MPVIDLSGSDPQPGGSGSARPPPRSGANNDSEVEEDDDDFVDANDMMMDDDDFVSPGVGRTSGETTRSSRLQPLLPDDYGQDETMAAIKFSEEFINRYGRPHPEFFPGSLEDAIRESCMKPAKDVRIYFNPLDIYVFFFLNIIFIYSGRCWQSTCTTTAVSYQTCFALKFFVQIPLLRF